MRSSRSTRVSFPRRDQWTSQTTKPTITTAATPSSHHGRCDSDCPCEPPTTGSSTSSTATAKSSTPKGSRDARLPAVSTGSHRRASTITSTPIGQVDVEHQPPAEVLTTQLHQQPPEQGADRGGDADARAEQAEGATTLRATEHVLDESRDLRGDQATTDALDDTCQRDPEGGLAGAAGGAGQGEDGDPDHEDRTARPRVTQPPGGHQRHAEGEGVPRHHPLDGRCRRPRDRS